jgi:hypothetical protein
MRVRVLYFKGCANSDETLGLVRRVASRQGVDAPIEFVEVRSPEKAIPLRFLGSPTVQIDDVDVDPAARNRADFVFVCRPLR